MTGPEDGPPQVARALLTVPATGGHGPARLDAVTAIAQALGCQTRSREYLTGHQMRAANGDYRLEAWGPAPLITWLSRAWPRILAALDRSAATAARDYARWLRHGCPDTDHMPSERRALRAQWYRGYLRVYGSTLATRIRGHLVPAARAGGASHLTLPHSPRAIAERDACLASLAAYVPPPAVASETSTLLVASGASGRAALQQRRRRSR